MDPALFTRVDPTTWRVEPTGRMRVPTIIYADLIRGMDDKVFTQATNVAMLPGIIGASYAMPDAHWGYGFPIGGVAAFDPARCGVVSAGGGRIRYLLWRAHDADRPSRIRYYECAERAGRFIVSKHSCGRRKQECRQPRLNRDGFDACWGCTLGNRTWLGRTA